MKRSYILLAILICCTSLFAQIDNCFSDRVAKGDSLFSSKKYEDALDYFVEAKSCVKKPDDLSILNEKIKKAKKEIDKAKNKTFSLDKNYVSINSEGASGRVSVTLAGMEKWDFDTKEFPSWLVVTKTKTGFDYECLPNHQPKGRSCSIQLKAGTLTQTFTVHQKEVKEYLIVSPTSVQFSSQAGEQTVNVSTNATSEVCIKSQLPWTKVTASQSDIRIEVEPNTKYDPRYGYIYLQTANCSQSIRVSQSAKPSNFLLDVAALRILSDFELSVSFRLKNGQHIQFDGGLWDILRYKNLSGGFSASYIWSYEFTDMWRLHYGIGLGIGGVKRPSTDIQSRFIVAAVPSIGIECAPKDWLVCGKRIGLTIDYRPYLGTDCVGFYHNATNINLGVRLHLH